MPVIGVRDWFVNKEIPTEDIPCSLLINKCCIQQVIFPLFLKQSDYDL